MTEPFRIALAYAPYRVGIRVIADADQAYGPAIGVTVRGDISPDEAIIFADALRTQADRVKAEIARREADKQCRGWLARLGITWR